MNPLLVGEDNPYGKDPRYALFPYPNNSAGARLARLVLAMPSRGEYLKRFDRVNLCASKWSVPIAREKAREIGLEPGRTHVVLLGSKVATAFGFAFEPFKVAQSGPRHMAMKTYVILPHPSGLCRLWNEPQAFERARAALTEAGVLP